MKRAFVIVSLLVALSLGIIAGTSVVALAPKEQVTFIENVIYGDKSVVEGVTIERNCKYNDQIYWNTHYTVGQNPITTTEYTYWQFTHSESVETGSLNVYSNPTGGYLWDEDVEALGVEKLYRELLEETKPGNSNDRTVYVKDYMENYYWEVGFFYKNFVMNLCWSDVLQEFGVTEEEEEFFRKFSEFLTIPVPENLRYNVYVKKDRDGYGIEAGYSVVEGDEFTMSMDPAFGMGMCYFVFDAHTSLGNVVDTSHIPGGFGIYAFAFDEETGTPDPDSLACVYSLDPEDTIDSLHMDVNKEKLLLFTSDKAGSYMTVIDVVAMKQLQKVDALGGSVDSCWDYDDFMVTSYDAKKIEIFSKDTNGKYNFEYSIDGNQYEGILFEKQFSGNAVYDWNGEQLLMAGGLCDSLEGRFYSENCGMYVTAFDENGLLFHGEYDSSLNTGIRYSNDKDERCVPTDNNPISVSWN